MAYLLRKAKFKKWENGVGTTPLNDECINSNIVADFNVVENRLSVWVVNENDESIPTVLSALASMYEKDDNLQYALIDEGCLKNLNLPLKDMPGDTYHCLANERYHRDLFIEGADTLISLVRVFCENARRERKAPREVVDLVVKAFNEHEINIDAYLNPRRYQMIEKVLENGQLNYDVKRFLECKVSQMLCANCGGSGKQSRGT